MKKQDIREHRLGLMRLHEWGTIVAGPDFAEEDEDDEDPDDGDQGDKRIHEG